MLSRGQDSIYYTNGILICLRPLLMTTIYHTFHQLFFGVSGSVPIVVAAFTCGAASTPCFPGIAFSCLTTMGPFTILPTNNPSSSLCACSASFNLSSNSAFSARSLFCRSESNDRTLDSALARRLSFSNCGRVGDASARTSSSTEASSAAFSSRCCFRAMLPDTSATRVRPCRPMYKPGFSQPLQLPSNETTERERVEVEEESGRRIAKTSRTRRRLKNGVKVHSRRQVRTDTSPHPVVHRLRLALAHPNGRHGKSSGRGEAACRWEAVVGSAMESVWVVSQRGYRTRTRHAHQQAPMDSPSTSC